MTVKREIRELEIRMKEVIKLFKDVYYNDDNSKLPKLEEEIRYLHWDLNVVLTNLKAL